MKDFKGDPLSIGDEVVFGTFSGMLERGTLTSCDKIGTSHMLTIVSDRADGTTVTHKLHSACVAKLNNQNS